MDGKFLFAAAQMPFEAGINLFCTLVPVSNGDGSPVDAEQDFPNRQLCWCLLRDPQFQDISPGQLVFGSVEPARDYSPSYPEKDRWQLRLDTAVLAGAPGSVLEIIDGGFSLPNDPRTLIEPRREYELDHKPSALVLVTLGPWLYGPFRPRHNRNGSDIEGRWRFGLERTAKSNILKVSRETLKAKRWIISSSEVLISLEATLPSRSTRSRPIRYSFLPWEHFDRLRSIGADQIDLKTDSEILLDAARDHLAPKRKRQELRQLIEELSDNLQAVPSANEVLEIATRLSNRLVASDREASDLTNALLSSGALDAQIESIKESRFQSYLETRAVEAEANIAERIELRQRELERIQAEFDEYETILQEDRLKANAALELELGSRRENAEASFRKERAELNEQREALRREKETLVQTVEGAANRFSIGRSEFLSDFLALVPALQSTGVLQTYGIGHPEAAPPIAPDAPAPLPAAFVARHSEPTKRLNELEFFARFDKHVDACGFSYRDIDLRAFHLLVKCGDLTVLSGLSGTGKSSLVRLYAEALAGEDEAARKRLLTIDVSPSWTEPQDLLGSVNLLDRRFEPATCGLFGHIVQAAQEHNQTGVNSGIVLIGLDEMNLAQVEHYLTGIFQALERPPPRAVRVFNPSALRLDDPLRDFAELPLPPSLRLIGTVNFDETTRPLSQRLKDRAAILELGGGRHGGLLAPRPGTSEVAGPPVLLADMQAWLNDKARMKQETAKDIAGLMDRMSAPLLRLGTPVTARRMQAIYRLFPAGADLLSFEEILDVAIATRVLPLLRGLDRPSAQSDASEIRNLLAEAPGGCPDSCRRLSAMLDESRAEWQAMIDEE